MGIPARWEGFGGHGVHPRVVLCALSGSPVVARKEVAGARGEGRRNVLAVTGSVGPSFSSVFARVQISSGLGSGRRRIRPWARIPARAWPFSFYFCLSPAELGLSQVAFAAGLREGEKRRWAWRPRPAREACPR